MTKKKWKSVITNKPMNDSGSDSNREDDEMKLRSPLKRTKGDRRKEVRISRTTKDIKPLWFREV